MLNRSLLLLGLLALGGCYSYSVVPMESAAAGTRVRARISATEADRLSEILGREERVLEGRVLPGASQGLLLEVPAALTTAGTSVRWMNQRIELAPADVLELEVRRLDPWRTAGAVAVLTTVVGYAAVQAFDAVGEPSGEGSKGGTDNYIGVSLPFPW